MPITECAEYMEFKAIIFDLDGTLLDTLEDLADAGNRVLAQAGLPVHSTDSYRYFVGDGLISLIQRILPEEMRTAEEVQRMALAFRDVYATNWNAKTKPYEGIEDMLATLQGRGLPMNILSNKPDDFTKVCVKEFFKESSFAHVLGNRDGVPKKPDPQGALKIASLLNLQPAEILYLGDTATDMKTAVRAGMLPVGALWGFRPERELEESGAKHLVGQPEDVVRLIG